MAHPVLLAQAPALAIRRDRETGVVSVAGELDLSNVDVLRECLLGLAPVTVELTLDLSGLTFIDATGLGVLVGAQRRRAAAGGGLTIVGARPMLVRLVRMAHLDRVLVLR